MTIAWNSGSISNDGERIAYEVSGEGPAVVFCHGLGGGHAVWFQQVPVFAERFRVVTWDQRGFGGSSNRSGDSGPAAAVADLGALLDHLEIDRAHLVGQSMGGWCVMGYALRSPKRVLSLSLCDSPAGVMTDAMAKAFGEGRARSPIDRNSIGAHPAIGDALRERDIAKAFLYQEIGAWREGIDDADMGAKLMATRYPISDVARLEVPVLLVVGDDDGVIPPPVIRAMADAVPNALLVEIADAGHSPYFEQPRAWNDSVLGFVESVGTRG